MIIKVNKAVSDYIKSEMSSEFSIASVIKSNENWHITAEVYEESTFLREVGIKTRAKDKNLYQFTLDEKTNIIGFEKVN